MKREPAAGELRLALGTLWLEAGEWQRAIKTVSRIGNASALAKKAAKIIAKAKAMGDEKRAPANYVRHLFDQFSARYDEHMLRDLSYRAPSILRTLAGFVGLELGKKLAILDLGCGTGLSGAAFRDLAKRLDGVDLSPDMIAMARKREVYDRLSCADLEEALARKGRKYDLILAADTLVYLGELAPVFARAVLRLPDGGMFLFTVERKAGTGYDLGRKRRYRHSEAYLREAAAHAGFEVAGLLTCVPRTDEGKPIKGLALALQRVKPRPGLTKGL